MKKRTNFYDIVNKNSILLRDRGGGTSNFTIRLRQPEEKSCGVTKRGGGRQSPSQDTKRRSDMESRSGHGES